MFAIATLVGFCNRLPVFLAQIVCDRPTNDRRTAIPLDLFVPVKRFQESFVKGNLDCSHVDILYGLNIPINRG